MSDTTVDMDLMLRLATRATARTIHRRPDQAAAPRPAPATPTAPAAPAAGRTR